MSEWGRKEYKDWPSRRPVWTWSAFLAAFVLLLGGLAYQYARQWTFAEREYLGNYLLASTLGRTRDKGHYRFVAYLDKKGNPYIASGDEIERVKMPDGRPGYELTEAGVQAGAVRLQIEDGVFSNAWMRQTLGHVVYGDRTVWEYVQWPVYGALGVFVVLLFYAVPKDRKRALVWKHGRRLRGPEVVTTAEFNERLGRKKGLNVYVPDGLALINENQSWGDRTFNNKLSRWVRIPRGLHCEV
jgi:hypothetical protein